MKILRYCIAVLAFFVVFVAYADAQWTLCGNLDGGGYATSFATIGSNLFVGSVTKGVFLSSDNGDTWIAVNDGLMPNKTPYITSLVVRGQTLYAGTYNSGVYRSSNNGMKWTAVNNGLTLGYPIKSMTLLGSDLFIGYEKGVFRSIDSGGSWINANNGLSVPIVGCMTTNGTDIYVCSAISASVFRSSDNGDTWKNISPFEMTGNANAVISKDSTILVATGSRIFRSTNNGKSWSKVDSWSVSQIVLSFTVKDSLMFAGTSKGHVFRSSDNGISWINTNLKSKEVRALIVKGESLFVGEVEGVWKTDINSLPSLVNEHIENGVESYLTCYPNPSVNLLSINLNNLPFADASPVKYTITNFTGRKVMEFEQYEKQFTIPVVGIGSGVYCLTAVQGASRAATMVTVVE